MSVQVGTMRSSVMYKNKFIIGDMTLRKILMVPCEMFCSDYLSSIRSIAMICSSRVRFDVNGV